jgi:PAS domain S-box-containing protein
MKKNLPKENLLQKRSRKKHEIIPREPKVQPRESADKPLKVSELKDSAPLSIEHENKKLKKIINDQEAQIKKYRELFHLAPIGYISLSKTGQVIEFNLTAAQLLNRDESGTKKFPLANLIQEDSKPIFNHFLWQTFTLNKKETCEIKVLVGENRTLDLQLTGLVSPTQEQCLATIADITDKKRVESELNKWATLFQPKGN